MLFRSEGGGVWRCVGYLPSAGYSGYATLTGVQSSAPIVSVAGGTADAITGTYTPAITALTSGPLLVRAGFANATTTPTFTPNSGVIAAKTIVKGANAALAAGDIAGAGHWIELQYDSTLDKWVLQNPATGVSVVAGVPTVNGRTGAVTTIVSAARLVKQRTAYDLTGIPSWAKRVTVMLNNATTSASSPLRFQLGDSGGIETTGYNGATWIYNASTYYSGGIDLYNGSSSNGQEVKFTLDLQDSATNTWGVSLVGGFRTVNQVDRKSTRLNSSHIPLSRMPSSA